MHAHEDAQRRRDRVPPLAIGIAAPALTAAAAWLAWTLVVSTDWEAWRPADVLPPAVTTIAAVAGARFMADVAVALMALARGRSVPRRSGRLARATAAALLAVLGAPAPRPQPMRPPAPVG